MPSFGFLETADALGVRAGERAAFVTEELAFEQGFGDGGAVDLHERAGRAGAPGMNDIGQHFLADAAFAGNQHARVRRRDQRHIAKDGLHQRAFGDDVRGQLPVFVVAERGGLGNAGGLLDRREQFIQIDGLGEVIHRAIAHGADGFANVGVGGHEQDRQRGVDLARAAQGFQPGEARHPHVGHHHGDVAVAQRFQGAFAGFHNGGLKPLAPQKCIEQAALACIVVHNQDPHR